MCPAGFKLHQPPQSWNSVEAISLKLMLYASTISWCLVQARVAEGWKLLQIGTYTSTSTGPLQEGGPTGGTCLRQPVLVGFVRLQIPGLPLLHKWNAIWGLWRLQVLDRSQILEKCLFQICFIVKFLSSVSARFSPMVPEGNKLSFQPWHPISFVAEICIQEMHMDGRYLEVAAYHGPSWTQSKILYMDIQVLNMSCVVSIAFKDTCVLRSLCRVGPISFSAGADGITSRFQFQQPR